MKPKGWFFKIIIVCYFSLSAPLLADTPWLHVDANQIKDPAGNMVVLRGVDLMDLGQTESLYGGAINMINRLTNKNNTEGNSPGWYPRVIRIMIGPPFDANNPVIYNLLRTTVDYCRTKDLYAIIDWHHVANTYDHRDSTSDFWRYMAPRFANDSHVMFELFNEPINDLDGDWIFNGNDNDDWASVKTDMQTWIDIVRTYAPNNIILVAGAYYSQIIGPAVSNPVIGDNIIMVSHIYPSHWLDTAHLPAYKSQIETALTRFPVFQSEWGFSMSASDTGLQGMITNFGQPVHDYREIRNISNSAWVASYNWGPPMFYNDWSLRVGEGEMGGFVKDMLYLKRNANQPVDNGDTTAPAAPTGLATTSVLTDRVALRWNANTEADLIGYDIFRSETPGTGFVRLNITRSKHPDFIDITVSSNTTYYYKITALDTSYNQSGDSNELVVEVPADTTPPARPMGLIATAGDGIVSLNWVDSTDTDLAGYNVYRSTTQGSGYVKLNVTLVSSSDYIDNSVTNGTAYFYVVTAVDTSSNESLYSDERTATPQAIVDVLGSWGTALSHAKEDGNNRALIFMVHAEYSNSGVSLNSVSYGGRPMTKIIDQFLAGSSNGVYAAAYILNDSNIIAADSSGTFSVSWTGTPSGYAYLHAFFKNVDQANPIFASSSGSSTTNPTTTAALSTNSGDMVIEGAACSTTGTFTLNNSFNLVSEYGMTGSDGVDGYKYATGASETPSVTHSATGSPRKVIIGFVLKTAPAPDLPPAEPVNLTAIADIGMVTLDWNDNSETDLAGYNIYRSTTPGAGYVKLNISILVESNYIDTDVTGGTPYYYVVTAVDGNNNESGYSNEASATPLSGYDDCAAVQAGGFGYLADLDHNCYVDYLDLAILTDYWLSTDCGSNANCEGADFTPVDGVVDFLDLNSFASQWMQCNDPENPDCSQNW